MLIIISFPVLLLLIVLSTVPFLQVKVIPSDHVTTKGDEITVSFQVTNHSIFPVSYFGLNFSYSFYNDNLKTRNRISMSMNARSEQIVHCHIKTTNCGMITYSCDSFQVYDYFRLFSLRKKTKEAIRIMILPKLYEIEENFIPNPNGIVKDGDIYSKQKPGDDPSEVFGIREYQEGDRLHRIHWKLSSKKDQLMIKEFSLPINCSVDIIVDLYCDNKRDKKYMDSLYEVVASLSNHFILSNIIHSITWYDSNKQECIRYQVEEWEQIYHVLEELYKAKIYQEQSKLLKLYQEEFQHEHKADIFYIAKYCSKELATYLNPSTFSKLHMLHLEPDNNMVDELDIKKTAIKIENVEASLKRLVF